MGQGTIEEEAERLYYASQPLATRCPQWSMLGPEEKGRWDSVAKEARLIAEEANSPAPQPGMLTVYEERRHRDVKKVARKTDGIASALVLLVSAWAARYGTAGQYVGTLREIADNLNLWDLADPELNPRARTQQLATILGNHAGQIIGEWRLIAIVGCPVRFALDQPNGSHPKPLDGCMGDPK